MLQENLFLYHRKPLAFSILSIRSTPGGQGRGVQRKCGLCCFLPSFFFSFPTSLVCVYVVWGCWLGKTQISRGCQNSLVFSQVVVCCQVWTLRAIKLCPFQKGLFQLSQFLEGDRDKLGSPSRWVLQPSPPISFKKTLSFKPTPVAQGRCPT